MIKVIDYRESTGFYGIRLYLSMKPKGIIQEYFSFKSKGKIVSKATQKALMEVAKLREAELIEQNELW